MEIPQNNIHLQATQSYITDLEMYLPSNQPRPLDHRRVTSPPATLVQWKQQWEKSSREDTEGRPSHGHVSHSPQTETGL